MQDGTAYRVERRSKDWVLLRRDESGEWESTYRFSLKPRELSNFKDRCHYHQTSPESHFTQKRVCTRLTPEGRITLRDQRLHVTENKQRSETPLVDDGAYLAALEKYFGIKLPAL